MYSRISLTKFLGLPDFALLMIKELSSFTLNNSQLFEKVAGALLMMEIDTASTALLF